MSRVLDEIDKGRPNWKWLRVGVFDVSIGERQVGEYVRNYPTLFRTFFAFQSGGRWLTLYSPQYTATRIIDIASGTDIGGEEPTAGGFCPVDYYVPTDPDGCLDSNAALLRSVLLGRRHVLEDPGTRPESGSRWNDRLRDERFGYLELSDKSDSLADAITVRDFDPHADHMGKRSEIRTVERYDLASGEPLMSTDVSRPQPIGHSLGVAESRMNLPSAR